jgi:hypothetical protein
MSTKPLWFNAKRASELVRVFEQTANKCRYGHPVCSNPDHYIGQSLNDSLSLALVNRSMQNKIDDFKSEDVALWHSERRAMHDIGEPAKYFRGRWNAIAKDIYYSNQPTYVFKGLGVSAVSFKPIAKVRISSTYWYLYVDIPVEKAFKTVSKNAKRKAIRYNVISPNVSEAIDNLLNKTVSHYINS